MDRQGDNTDNSMKCAQRDIMTLGIATAAILLFVGTGGSVLPDIARSMRGIGNGPDVVLANALLLNIALIIFGWRRYRELRQEIEERRLAEEKALKLSEIDPLTGCLNRRSIASGTDRILSIAKEPGSAVAFLMIDIDNFKQINDMNGHQTGDEVLKAISCRISELLPDGALIARLGGDEFACVIHYDRKNPAWMDQFAACVITATAQPVDISGTFINVTISIGIASSDRDFDAAADEPDAQSLMHRADIAMYQAKKHGKDRYSWFETPMENELRFRNELEMGIRRGITAGEFVPYYEQQVDINTGELMGFEMLARWNSEQLGVVSPDIFIPIAEEIGVIGDLSEQLIAQAFIDAKRWDPKLTLAVNISPHQLRDPWFSQKLLKLIVEHNFPPARLEVEITESCLHENMGVVRSMITSLRNQGVHISLDDFGTGYSSLSQLRSLPFDRLKIDRSFVKELSTQDASSAIIQSIIDLGHGLDLPITAEGIEDEDSLQLLKAFGPLKGQGFYYGQPETADLVRLRLLALDMYVESFAAGEEIAVDIALSAAPRDPARKQA